MIGADAPLDGDDLTSWKIYEGGIECSGEDKIALAVCDASGRCAGSCKINLVVAQ